MSEVQLTVRSIGRLVGDYYSVKWDDILSHRRTADVTRPRHVTAWAARHHTHLSLPAIGRRMGGRDHTTVRHSVLKMEKDRKVDQLLDRELIEIELLIDVERKAFTRFDIQADADLDPVEIAQRVLTRPRGEFGISIPEARTLAQAVVLNFLPVDALAANAEDGLLNMVEAIDALTTATRKVGIARGQEARFLAIEEQRAAFAALTALSESIKKEFADERTT